MIGILIYNTIIFSGTSAHEYWGEQSKYKYKFWCKFCCWPPFTVITSLVPRKLLIFPLNFGLSFFVLVLVFSLSASELASASLLVPNYIFGLIRSYIYVWFSIFTLLVACKKSFACCCCIFFHPKDFVYRSLSINIPYWCREKKNVFKARAPNSTALIPTAGFAFILCQANCNPLQTYLSVWASTPSVRVFH